MKENYVRALPRVLVYEGGYVDDPRDPGGETNKGVTAKTYGFYRSSHGLPARGVALISPDEVADIYRTMYWDICRCDDLPSGVDFAVFDVAVNSGPGAAGRMLQQALGADYTGRVDGLIGAGTITAANAAKDRDALVAGVCARRLAFLQRQRAWKTYSKGWSARVANVVKIGQAWASGSAGPNPVEVASAGGNVKATPDTVKKPLVPVRATAAVAAVGSAGATLTEMTQVFDPIRQLAGEGIHWIAATFGTVGAFGAALSGLAHSQFITGLSAGKGELEVADLDLSADMNFAPVSIAAAQ